MGVQGGQWGRALGKGPVPSCKAGLGLCPGPLVTGPGLCPASPSPGTGSTAFCARPAAPWGARGWPLPVTPSPQTGRPRPSRPPQGGEAPPPQHPKRKAKTQVWVVKRTLLRSEGWTLYVHLRVPFGGQDRWMGKHSQLRPPRPPGGASAAGACPGWHAGQRARGSAGRRSADHWCPGRACGGGG